MRSLLLTCALLLSACSFVFVKDAKEPALSNPVIPLDCTSSRALPAIDLAIGAVLGALAAGVTYWGVEQANDETCPNCYSGTKPAILGAFLVVSPWWISSAVGFSDTSRCRKAFRQRGYEPP